MHLLNQMLKSVCYGVRSITASRGNQGFPYDPILLYLTLHYVVNANLLVFCKGRDLKGTVGSLNGAVS